MNNKMGRFGWIAAILLSAGSAFAAQDQAGKWKTAEQDGRIEANFGKSLMLAWQKQPLANPAGGEKFAGSAFLHPLRTPSGFEWTTIQPKDHLHHFGLWWPWKFIEVEGTKFNCWEIQENQGAHVARSAKTLTNGPDSLEWEFTNELIVKKPDTASLTAIHETARVALAIHGDAQVLDISLAQKAADKPVTIAAYRYSGFSWRGPGSWNKDNGQMITSEGHGRDDANGKPARWVLVTGPTPSGTATVLIMSAATKLAGTPERLRIWDSRMENGTPFINFNPVMKEPLPLNDAHPAVSNRKYRVIAADHLIDAAAAEAEWQKWQGK